MLVPLYHLNQYSQYFCDYFYKNTIYSYYTLRGGTSYLGEYCGAFFVNATSTASSVYWLVGASISFKHM